MPTSFPFPVLIISLYRSRFPFDITVLLFTFLVMQVGWWWILSPFTYLGKVFFNLPSLSTYIFSGYWILGDSFSFQYWKNVAPLSSDLYNFLWEKNDDYCHLYLCSSDYFSESLIIAGFKQLLYNVPCCNFFIFLILRVCWAS